jgi:hypothetical protein
MFRAESGPAGLRIIFLCRGKLMSDPLAKIKKKLQLN